MRRTGHIDGDGTALGTIDLDPLDKALGYSAGKSLIAIRQFSPGDGVQLVRLQTTDQIRQLIAELMMVCAIDQRARGYRPARGIAGFLGLEEIDEQMNT